MADRQRSDRIGRTVLQTVPLKLEAKDIFAKHKPDPGRRKNRKMPFLSLVTLTFQLWPRLPSERPNTSSLWIWRKRAFSGSRGISYTKKNTDWWRQKHNLPQFTACGNKKQYTQ